MYEASAKAHAYQGAPDQVKRIVADMRQNSLEIKARLL